MQTYADAAVLIDDPQVLACRIADIGEPLVDISTFPGLAVDVARAGVQQLSDNPFQVRSGVAGRLVQAQEYLPDGYRLQIKEGWRPVWVQERIWQESLNELRTRLPASPGQT